MGTPPIPLSTTPSCTSSCTRANAPSFTRTESNRNVPQVRVDLADLPDSFLAKFALARAGRCQAPLKDLPEAQLCRILAAAVAVPAAAQSRAP